MINFKILLSISIGLNFLKFSSSSIQFFNNPDLLAAFLLMLNFLFSADISSIEFMKSFLEMLF